MAEEQTGEDTAGGPDQTGPLNKPAAVGSLPARLRTVYGRRIGAAEKALMLSWAAFGTTFGTARAITHLLRWRDGGSGGSGGIVIAGRHVHHFNFGIALLTAVGGVAVHGQEPTRRHPVTAAAYPNQTAASSGCLTCECDPLVWHGSKMMRRPELRLSLLGIPSCRCGPGRGRRPEGAAFRTARSPDGLVSLPTRTSCVMRHAQGSAVENGGE